MANFMGPMAPPQAAPGQPPQLDIRTNPNQRQRFRNFMRQNTRPAGMTGVPPMYPASQTPFPAAPMPPMARPAPAPIMPMQMAQPMRPPMQQPMGPARNVDIFSPQYMQAQPPVGMEDGGAVPPRRVDIRGQDHMLAYITPKEAGILKALGGSGEAGPMGIPSYPDAEHGGQDSAGPADSGGSMSGPGDMGSDFDSGYTSDYGSMEADDARAAAEQAAIDAVNDMISDNANRSPASTQQGQYDSHAGDTTTSDAETDDPVTAGKQSSEYDSEVSVFGIPEDERNFVERNIISRMQDKGQKGFSIETDDLGRFTGYTEETTPLGTLGFLSSIFDMPISTYTGFGKGAGIGDGSDMGGDGASEIVNQTIAATAVPQSPVTNVMGGMGSSYVAPPSLPSPLVPSDRAYTPTNLPMPVGYGAVPTGAINPLAYLPSGFPVGTQFFADGGQVLDQAAGRFLEALTAA